MLSREQWGAIRVKPRAVKAKVRVVRVNPDYSCGNVTGNHTATRPVRVVRGFL
jgi:hypothetical protein